MQLEQPSPTSHKINPVIEKLLPFVKPFAYSWFNLQAQKRKYQKKHDSPMPVTGMRAAKEGLKATSESIKEKWTERLLSKLLKDVVAESRDGFVDCVVTKDFESPCIQSQPDRQGKMRRIDCFKQADKIWRLDLVAVILFKGVPLENTDSERLERTCSSALCINPYHVLVVCKELDLYTSHCLKRYAENGASKSKRGIILASVHSMSELLEGVEDADDHGDDVDGDLLKEGLPLQDRSRRKGDEGVERKADDKEPTSRVILPDVDGQQIVQCKHPQLIPKKLPKLFVTSQQQQIAERNPLPSEFGRLRESVERVGDAPAIRDDRFARRLPLQSSTVVPKDSHRPDPQKQKSQKNHFQPQHVLQQQQQHQQQQSKLNDATNIPQHSVQQSTTSNAEPQTFQRFLILNHNPTQGSMFFSVSGEQVGHPRRVIAPSHSLASTLSSLLPSSSSLTLPGTFLMLQPMTSETSVRPSDPATAMSPMPFHISSSRPTLMSTPCRTPGKHQGPPSYTHFPSPLLMPPSSLSSFSSSSFNLDQFLDFSHSAQTPILPPVSSMQSSLSSSSTVASFATLPPSASPSSTSILATPAVTTKVTTTRVSKSRARKCREPAGSPPRTKRQRRATITGPCDVDADSRLDFYADNSLSDERISAVGSKNFLRLDRGEGFKLFQSPPSTNVVASPTIQSNRSVDHLPLPANGVPRTKKAKLEDRPSERFIGREPIVGRHRGDSKEGQESPSSDRGSPVCLPQFFTKELLLSTQNVTKPVAIFSLGDRMASAVVKALDNKTSSQTRKECGGDDDDDDDDAGDRLRISTTSDDDDEDGESDRTDARGSSVRLGAVSHRALEVSPITIIPAPDKGIRQAMLSYPCGVGSSTALDGNNPTSNPVLCCFNAGGLLSPTPPFILSSSPVVTPKTTPCSTPTPPRWCTPYFLEGDSEAYPTFMVNFVNFEEICHTNESSGASSDRCSQMVSTPNLSLFSHRLKQESNKDSDDDDDDDDDGGGVDNKEVASSKMQGDFEKSSL